MVLHFGSIFQFIISYKSTRMTNFGWRAKWWLTHDIVCGIVEDVVDESRLNQMD